MNKIIFAYGVSDITVARYCSAMMVDFIIIDVNERNYEENTLLLKNILEWISGPQIILTSDDQEKIQFFKSEYEFQSLLKSALFESVFELQVNSENINFQCLDSSSTKTTSTLSLFVIHESSTISEIPKADGYIIMMGKEKKVGIFDFERIDSIFEYINSF